MAIKTSLVDFYSPFENTTTKNKCNYGTKKTMLTSMKF